MPYYAQINSDNIVYAVNQTTGIINSPDMIELTNYDTNLIGKKYNNGIFEEISLPPLRNITLLSFRNRFTNDEKVAIYILAQTNIQVRIWLDDLNAVSNNIVNLDDPNLISALQTLELLNIIAPGRSTEILS